MTAKEEKPTWRCHDCNKIFRAWAPAQRHANELGHNRIELVLWPTR